MDKYTKYLPLALFSLLAIKLIITGASFADTASLFVLAAAAAYYEFQIQKKIRNEYKEQLQKYEDQVKALALSLDEVRTHVGSLKLSQTRFTNVR